jgi:TRAP-type C4-dicarboxylate transport system substrate-binding protein
MNTEKLKTLEQISKAMDEVNEASQNPENTPEEQKALDQISVMLQKMQNDIILKTEKELVSALNQPGKDLAELSKALNNSTEKLKKISKTVLAVSKTVGVLVQIITSAASAGLL